MPELTPFILMVQNETTRHPYGTKHIAARLKTHVAVDDGTNVVLVVLLNGCVCEKGVGVVCGIAPCQVVDLGVSGVPLITKGQDQLDAVVASSVDDVVQSPECLLIVFTCAQYVVKSDNLQKLKTTAEAATGDQQRVCEGITAQQSDSSMHLASALSLSRGIRLCMRKAKALVQHCRLQWKVTLLWLQGQCGVDAMSKHTSSCQTVVSSCFKCEVHRR